MSVETLDLTPNLRIRIEYDSDPLSPREGCDPFGEIVYASSRYVLGDRDVGHVGLDEIRDRIDSGELIGMPVFAYIHSGVVIKAAYSNPFNCQWDSGQSGFVYCTKEAAIKEFGKVRMTKEVEAKALELLKAEVETYSQFLAGECYGYVVERVTRDDDGDETGTEELDSCWGFLGDVSYCMEEAKAAAKPYMEAESAPA